MNEIFFSLQGEGSRVGRPTTFIRLAGCNLQCPWCDTDHKAFKEMDEDDIVREIFRVGGPTEWVCITGGEPFVQNITHLVFALGKVQIETNGLMLENFHDILSSVELLTVSPKLWATDLYQWDRLHWLFSLPVVAEVKFVVDEVNDPGDAIQYLLQEGSFPIYLQPESCKEESTEKCIQQVKRFANERVRLGLQVHKIVGMR